MLNSLTKNWDFPITKRVLGRNWDNVGPAKQSTEEAFAAVDGKTTKPARKAESAAMSASPTQAFAGNEDLTKGARTALQTILKSAAKDMPGFLEQDRPKKVKEIYKALKREHPDMPAGQKARIASSKGAETKEAAADLPAATSTGADFYTDKGVVKMRKRPKSDDLADKSVKQMMSDMNSAPKVAMSTAWQNALASALPSAFGSGILTAGVNAAGGIRGSDLLGPSAIAALAGGLGGGAMGYFGTPKEAPAEAAAEPKKKPSKKKSEDKDMKKESRAALSVILGTIS